MQYDGIFKRINKMSLNRRHIYCVALREYILTKNTFMEPLK